MKPFRRIKGRNSLVALRRRHLRGPRVPILVQIPKTPFYSVRLGGLVWVASALSYADVQGLSLLNFLYILSISYILAPPSWTIF